MPENEYNSTQHRKWNNAKVHIPNTMYCTTLCVEMLALILQLKTIHLFNNWMYSTCDSNITVAVVHNVQAYNVSSIPLQSRMYIYIVTSVQLLSVHSACIPQQDKHVGNSLKQFSVLDHQIIIIGTNLHCTILKECE